MGSLLHLSSRRLVMLGARQVVGRSRRMDIRIANRRVSAEHASVVWSGGCWMLRDLGSTNGTFLDGRLLPVRDRISIGRNALLAFGDAQDAWRLVSDSPPLPQVCRLGDGVIIEQAGPIIGLPSPDQPEVLVYWADNQWVVEQNGVVRKVSDVARVEVDGQTFELRFAVDMDGTLSETDELQVVVEPLGQLQFIFRSDPKVGSGMDVQGRDGPLGLRPRAHHASLLMLAKKRLHDRERGESAERAGWVDFEETAESLQIDPKTLNVHIFRAREELARHGICGASAVVERRPHSRQLRFGSADVVLALD